VAKVSGRLQGEIEYSLRFLAIESVAGQRATWVKLSRLRRLAWISTDGGFEEPVRVDRRPRGGVVCESGDVVTHGPGLSVQPGRLLSEI
jgi:hypothetical protein